MPPKPPETVEEILATGIIDPVFDEAVKTACLRAGSSYTLSEIKKDVEDSLPKVQEQLQSTRPSEITERQHWIKLRDDYASRIIVCHLTADLESTATTARPLIVLFHGGGHTVGYPEMEVPLARELTLAHGAVVVCASYRLAPRFPFPFSICDAWETLTLAASEARKANSAILPRSADARAGFIVGGVSSGAGLAAALAHLARDHQLRPPLTGQLLCAGSFISDAHVPAAYRDRYLSWTQNEHAPIVDRALVRLFRDAAFKPDLTSKLFASFDQHHPSDERSASGSVRHGHLHLAPAYFQVCGAGCLSR